LELAGLTPSERELTIVNHLAAALQEMGGRYILPFTFRDQTGNRTKHHLIFVTKHIRGYEIMKEVMANESTAEQGVPTFEYNPASRRQTLLFELSRPLDELGEMLMEEFRGQTRSMKEVYERHHVGRRFIERNYKEVLTTLEENGSITTDPPMHARPIQRGKRTFGPKVRVTFPE
jgi:hypothetical protein